jgi:hypothetical protein
MDGIQFLSDGTEIMESWIDQELAERSGGTVGGTVGERSGRSGDTIPIIDKRVRGRSDPFFGLGRELASLTSASLYWPSSAIEHLCALWHHGSMTIKANCQTAQRLRNVRMLWLVVPPSGGRTRVTKLPPEGGTTNSRGKKRSRGVAPLPRETQSPKAARARIANWKFARLLTNT